MARRAQIERSAHEPSAEPPVGPQRTCLVTREVHPPAALIRFVVAPDGALTPDLARKLPGRGVWVLAHAATVIEAVRRKVFSKRLGQPVTVPADLAARIDGLMVDRVIGALSLANKAGAVITGFSKLEAAIPRGKVVALMHGSDASADGSGKLDRLLAAVARASGFAPGRSGVLTVAHLSLALGRPHVVHAGLSESGITKKVMGEAERLERYRSAMALPQERTPAPSAPCGDGDMG